MLEWLEEVQLMILDYYRDSIWLALFAVAANLCVGTKYAISSVLDFFEEGMRNNAMPREEELGKCIKFSFYNLAWIVSLIISIPVAIIALLLGIVLSLFAVVGLLITGRCERLSMFGQIFDQANRIVDQEETQSQENQAILDNPAPTNAAEDFCVFQLPSGELILGTSLNAINSSATRYPVNSVYGAVNNAVAVSYTSRPVDPITRFAFLL